MSKTVRITIEFTTGIEDECTEVAQEAYYHLSAHYPIDLDSLKVRLNNDVHGDVNGVRGVDVLVMGEE